MPAALAVPLIIGAASAGAQVYGAHKASNAAKDAAKVQVDATNKAQSFNERAYADQQKALAPYQQAGNDSLARLMAQHWGTALPPGMSPTSGSSAMLGNASQMFTPRPAGPQYGPNFQPTQGPGAVTGQGGQGVALGGGQQPPMSLAAMQGNGGQQPMQQPPQPPQGNAPMVKVRAPTGETAQFPDGSPGLQQALAKGAVRF